MKQDHVVKRKQNINTKVGLNPRNFSKLCVFCVFIHTYFPLWLIYGMKGNPWKWNNNILLRGGSWKNLYMHVNLYIYACYVQMNICIQIHIYVWFICILFMCVNTCIYIMHITYVCTVCIYLHNVSKFTLSSLLRGLSWWLSRYRIYL